MVMAKKSNSITIFFVSCIFAFKVFKNITSGFTLTEQWEVVQLHKIYFLVHDVKSRMKQYVTSLILYIVKCGSEVCCIYLNLTDIQNQDHTHNTKFCFRRHGPKNMVATVPASHHSVNVNSEVIFPNFKHKLHHEKNLN